MKCSGAECRYYGKTAVRLIGKLASSGGNQCALITSSHSPCVMELVGRKPVLEDCPRRDLPEAIEWADWPIVNLTAP